MFYKSKNDIPPLDSICFVQLADYNIKSTDLGVYVKIIDYDMRDGFIPITEVSKYKTNFQKIFKHDKVYPCIVFSYDTNLINLSYMKIKEEKRGNLLTQFIFAKKINNIREFLNKNNCDSPYLLEPDMYENLSVEKLFNQIVETPDKYFGKKDSELIKSKIICEPTEAIKYFKLIICQDNGLNKLKMAIGLFTEYLSKYEYETKIECVSSPIYSIRLKYISLDDNFFSKVFDDFEKILNENNINNILNELELKVHKEKISILDLD